MSAELDTLNKQLIEAAQDGKSLEVKSLLEKGADIHADDDDALRRASGTGRVNTVKLLLECGADVHAGSGNSLYWPLLKGYSKTVSLLLQHGANPFNIPDFLEFNSLVKLLLDLPLLNAADRSRLSVPESSVKPGV